MKKISKMLKTTVESRFPVLGKEGYGGEQDGSSVRFSGEHIFSSKQEADREFPNGLPDFVEIHRASYHPTWGWTVVFAWWTNEETKEKNPLKITHY